MMVTAKTEMVVTDSVSLRNEPVRSLAVVGISACLLIVPTLGETRQASTQVLPEQMGDLVPELSDIGVEFGAIVDPGDVAEGCAASIGPIDLLRFSRMAHNKGTVDIRMGDPRCPDPCSDHPLAVCENPSFICSPAGGHNHAHFRDFARYELRDVSGQNVVARGHKESFCLRDTICDTEQYTCGFQGISAGCADLYVAFLGCQYVEITGVEPGEYLLRVALDPENRIAESDDTNNVANVRVVIPPRPTATPTPSITPTGTIPSRTPTTTPTRTPSPTPACFGDCSGDRRVHSQIVR